MLKERPSAGRRVLMVLEFDRRTGGYEEVAAPNGDAKRIADSPLGEWPDQPIAIVIRNSALVFTFFNRPRNSSMASTTFMSLKTLRRR